MKKTILLGSLIISLSFLQAISPFSIDPVCQKNPLNACDNCNSWKENRLIELLDDVIAAKRYWLTVGDRPWYRVITRPLHHWFYFSWQTEIREHVSTLDDLQNILAIKLSKVIGEECQETDEDLYKIINDAKTVLRIHGIPLHIARNWLFYVGAAAAAYKIASFYTAYLKNTVVIKFDPKDRDTIKEVCQNSKNNHTLTLEKEALWFTTSQEKLEEFQKKLENYSVQPLQEARKANKNDLYRLFLTESGEFIPKAFWRVCAREPFDNICNLLKKNNENKKANLSELEEKSLKDAYAQSLLEALNLASQLKKSDGSNKYPQIARHFNINKTFDDLPLERMQQLLFNEIPLPVLERLEQIVKDAIRQGPGEAVKACKDWLSSIFGSSSDKASDKNLSFQEPRSYTFESKILEAGGNAFKFYTPTVTHSISNFTQALDFLTESAKMTPFMLASYLGYKGVTGANHWYRNHYFKEPLRYDLKDFINFLDENLYTHVSNPAFKGLHYYWTARLKQYKKFMSNKDRIYFEKDLQKLTRGATISHEIEILRVILYNELEHL